MRILTASAACICLTACDTSTGPVSGTVRVDPPGVDTPRDRPGEAAEAPVTRPDDGGPPTGETPSTGDAVEPEAPLLEVAGQVSAALEAAPEPLEVGVLWLNLLDDNQTVLIEAAASDAIGRELPAAFDASLIVPPSDAMLGVTLQSWSEGGGSERPVDPSRVAFGVVVVAPEGTLATLPPVATLGDFINGSSAEPGPLLSSFTLVSSYAVRYVKDAEAEGVVLRDIQGVPYALADFTLTDLGAWARGIDNALCRDRRLGEGWDTPEVKACIEANTERIAAGEAASAECAAACPEAAEGEFDRCRWDCMTQGDTSGNVGNECLYQWQQSQAEATDALCGPQPDLAESDFRSARRLDQGEQLTLTLGQGDIRSALTAGGFTFLY
jgi:hypothetical protein